MKTNFQFVQSLVLQLQVRNDTSAYVSIRKHTSAYVSIRQRSVTRSAAASCVSIRIGRTHNREERNALPYCVW